MGEGNKYLSGGSLQAVHSGKATVSLYPLGQYRIVVNQDYIRLSKEYSFHVFGAVLSGYRTIEHWYSIGSLTTIRV